jgi:uncharacterized protein YbjT (DUF2867 family)
MDDTLPRVLVLGASGYIGSNLVPQLAASGVRVRAASRNPEVLAARCWTGVDLVAADALKPETLPAALAGIETAYYLVHSMASGLGFGRLDVEAAANFAAAAARAGVTRIVYLGGLIPDGATSEHLRSRLETGETLRAGAVPVTEIRAGIIVGPGSAAYEIIRDLVNALPVMLAPVWIRSKSAPIALDNLLAYLIAVPGIAATAGQVLDAAGPDYISYATMMRSFGALVGKRPRIVPVPLLTPRLCSYGLGLVTAVPTGIARALIGGLGHDIPAEDTHLRGLVPQTLLSYRQAVIAALDAEKRHAVAARWTEGALMFRDYRQDHAFYAKRAGASIVTTASPRALWQVITSLGGDNGYFYADILWRVRAAMDWMVGGPGLSKGRRDPAALRLGDKVDYWTVVALEPERHLTLQFGMRAPGSGVLEFDIVPVAHGGSRLGITAYWHPHGVWGLSYWYAMVPAHLFIFRGMADAIARQAQAHPASEGSARPALPIA